MCRKCAENFFSRNKFLIRTPRHCQHAFGHHNQYFNTFWHICHDFFRKIREIFCAFWGDFAEFLDFFSVIFLNHCYMLLYDNTMFSRSKISQTIHISHSGGQEIILRLFLLWSDANTKTTRALQQKVGMIWMYAWKRRRIRWWVLKHT